MGGERKTVTAPWNVLVDCAVNTPPTVRGMPDATVTPELNREVPPTVRVLVEEIWTGPLKTPAVVTVNVPPTVVLPVTLVLPVTVKLLPPET